MSDNERAARLAELHAGWQPRHDLINRSVSTATGRQVVGAERVIKGESNVVLFVDLDDGRRVVARAHQESKPWFGAETVALRKCRDAGLPVPETLRVDHYETDEGIYSVSVSSLLDGEPLDEALDAGRATPTPDLLAQIRDLASAIHALDGTGLPGPTVWPWDESFVRYVERSHRELHQLGLDALRPVIDEAYEAMLALDIRTQPGAVTHGDFGTKHVFVRDGIVTGILDFEETEAGDPARDIANWMYWGITPHAADIWGEDAHERYGDDIDARVSGLMLAIGIRNMHYFAEREWQGGAVGCIARLSSVLRFRSLREPPIVVSDRQDFGR